LGELNKNYHHPYISSPVVVAKSVGTKPKKLAIFKQLRTHLVVKHEKGVSTSLHITCLDVCIHLKQNQHTSNIPHSVDRIASN